jgi:hypothetical protein
MSDLASRVRGPKLLIAVAVLLVVATGFTWTFHRLTGRSSGLCAPAEGSFKVFRDHGDCAGTTDGSYVFAPVLAGVEHKIAAENRRAVRSGDYVSVALFTPLTTRKGSDISLARIEGELDGAYAAQFNADSTVNAAGPRIQLLLASEGSFEQAWQPVVSQLTSQTARAAHLVAVTGMGLSLTETVRSAWALHRAGLPMVGSVFTADSLDWAHIPGLIHVMPNNAQQTSALHAYLTARHLLGNLFLVTDTDPTDLYTENLGADFSAAFGSSLPDAQYGPPADQMPGELSAIAALVCPVKRTAQPPVVLYAGREVLLPGFLSSLRGNADCQGKQLTVVAGSDAAALSRSVTAPASGLGGLTVIYSDLTNPSLVNQATRQIFTASGLGPGSLSGTWTIATYDAMAAVAKAISLDATHGQGRPVPGSISYYLRFLHGRDQVAGATGPLGISTAGDPVDPSVPVMRMSGGQPPAPQPG